MVRRWVSAAGGPLGRPADGLGFHHVTEKEEVAGRKKVYIRRLVSLHLVEPVRFSRQACIEGQGAATRALVSSREPPPKPAASGGWSAFRATWRRCLGACQCGEQPPFSGVLGVVGPGKVGL